MNKRRKSSGGRRGILFLAVALVLLVLLTGIAVLWERQAYAPAPTTPPTVPTGEAEATSESTQPVQPTEVTMPTQAADHTSGKQVLNVLITGQDRWDPDNWGRSDSMILCSIDARKDTVTMISFLRDLYVPIPGHGSSKLNAAYSWGGIELLNKTLDQNFGAPIDGNIEIDFFDFMNLIDYLGGVEIELTAEEANYLNTRGTWAALSEEPWNLTAGVNHLTGAQALDYSRIRYLDSDFVRTERQRTVLTQVLGKLQNLSWDELVDAMDMLLENSVTSFSKDEMLLYVLGFYPVLADGQIITARIPADETWEYATVSGMSVVKADLDANRALLQQWLDVQEHQE